MIRRILVGLGGFDTQNASYTESATQMAIDLAQRHEARLSGVTVVNATVLNRVGPVPLGAGAAAADLREHRQEETRTRIDEAVAHFRHACKVAGVYAEVHRESSDRPFDYLISQARYHDVTLMGLRGLFEYGVCGEAQYDPASSLVQLIEGGVRPLLATGPKPRRVERVMIAYSGSNHSAKTMRRFAQMQLWPDAMVRVVSLGPDRERHEGFIAHAANYLKDHGIEVEQEYQPVDPKSGVLKLAQDWGADLIVMGNSSRSLLSRRVLGDTMLETIRESDIPLFLAQ